jgi:hypothetical protein
MHSSGLAPQNAAREGIDQRLWELALVSYRRVSKAPRFQDVLDWINKNNKNKRNGFQKFELLHLNVSSYPNRNQRKFSLTSSSATRPETPTKSSFLQI